VTQLLGFTLISIYFS